MISRPNNFSNLTFNYYFALINDKMIFFTPFRGKKIFNANDALYEISQWLLWLASVRTYKLYKLPQRLFLPLGEPYLLHCLSRRKPHETSRTMGWETL